MQRRPLHAALHPYVECLWVGHRLAAAGREHVLPTAGMHLAVRLEGGDVRIYDEPHAMRPAQRGDALLAGARAMAYWKDASVATRTVGVQLRPGATRALLGVSAAEVCGRHVSLDDVWGDDGRRLRDALHEASTPEMQMASLEAALLAKLRPVGGMHPAVAAMLAQVHASPASGRLPRPGGISERHLIARFREATGLSPKRYARVHRFQHLLRVMRLAPDRSLLELALDAGYSDQSHCSRDFMQLAGITPHAWRLQQRAKSQAVEA